jgi:hypothetical protein
MATNRKPSKPDIPPAIRFPNGTAGKLTLRNATRAKRVSERRVMEPCPGWEAQLGQLSTQRLGQLISHTGLFVQTIRQRWAASQFVPSWCTVAWIDDLAGRVMAAERRLTGGGAEGLGRWPPALHPAPPVAPGAVLTNTGESEQQRLAAIRTAVRRAQTWEPAAHERAAELHERAAEIQARLGHQDRAEQARRFAALARGRILSAYTEQAAWETTLVAFDHRAAAATRPPDPADTTS